MSMGGGSGGGGGAIVQSTAPWASYAAGQYQTAAAYAAQQAASEQTNNAINMIRDQYTNAFTSLKPYTTEGIQALNELNSYMGLKAYNPGTAPRAPDKPTLQSELANLTPQDINRYIIGNSQAGSYTGATGGGFNNMVYYGGSGDDAASSGGTAGPGQGGATNFGYVTGTSAYGQPMAQYGLGLGNVRQSASNMLANQALKQDMKAYNSQFDQYNQQMDVYNFAKDLQGQYDAAGPLTPDQVAAKLAQTPGYQFQLGQGVDAIQRAASSKGMLGSGRLLQSLVDYGQGMASQTYGQTLSRLAGLAEMGSNAAGQQSQNFANLGNTTGQLQAQLGDTIANSFLAAGNAQAQGVIGANQQYNVMGGGGGGGMGGIGSALGGLGSLASGLGGLFSSKSLKDKLNTPTKEEILARVKELDIDRWIYKGTNVAHLGPYAEDFKEKFGVGDGQSINLIDVIGVLLSSVQALSAKIDTMTLCAETKKQLTKEIH